MTVDLETNLPYQRLQRNCAMMMFSNKCCFAALTLFSLLSTINAATPPPQNFHKPADSANHVGTFMSWPTRYSIFGDGQGWDYEGEDLRQTREEIANIAKTIAKYEPVQMLVRDPETVTDKKDPDNLKSAKKLLGNAKNVTLVVTPDTDSLWMRDTGPLFVVAEGNGSVENTWPEGADAGIGLRPVDTESSVVGLDLHFNQWGRKLPPSPDSYVAPKVCQTVNISCLIAPFVGEGGAIEVDGEGTLLATESSLLNPNRNPGITKDQLEAFFNSAFGVTKTIWLPGFAGDDITDDHIDGIARFAAPGVVLLSRPYLAPGTNDTEGVLDDYNDAVRILNSTTDAKGRPFKTFPVYEPDPEEVYGKDYDPNLGVATEYVNFHLVNGGVVMSAFGVKEVDDAAAKAVQAHFPDRKVEQVLTYQLGLQGGGIHCSTQQYFV